MTIRATLLPALAMCAGLCACGDAGSSAANTITPAKEIAEARANSLAVSPLPGTEDASPSTQISFLGDGGHDRSRT